MTTDVSTKLVEAMRCMNEASCGAPISVDEAIRRAKVEVAKMPGALRNAKLRHIEDRRAGHD